MVKLCSVCLRGWGGGNTVFGTNKAAFPGATLKKKSASIQPGKGRRPKVEPTCLQKKRMKLGKLKKLARWLTRDRDRGPGALRAGGRSERGKRGGGSCHPPHPRGKLFKFRVTPHQMLTKSQNATDSSSPLPSSSEGCGC